MRVTDSAVVDGQGQLIHLAGGLTVLLASGPAILAATSPGRCEWIDVRRAVAPRVLPGMLGARRSVVIAVDVRVGDDGVPIQASVCDAHEPELETAVMIAALQWRFHMNTPEQPAARHVMLLFFFECDDCAASDETPSVVFDLPWNVYIRVPAPVAVARQA